jgi:CheY-like chemotaxis protein
MITRWCAPASGACSSWRPAVTSEAADADRAYALFIELAPDVTVMDLSMPGVSDLEAIRRMDGRVRLAPLAARGRRASADVPRAPGRGDQVDRKE